MHKLAVLPVIALAALAVAPGCSSRRARTAAVPPPVVQAPMAQAPVYVPTTDPNAATKSDVIALDQKLDALAEELRNRPAPMPAPAPAPMPSYSPVAVAPEAPATGGDAARFVETLRSRGVDHVEQNGSTVTIRLTDAFRPGSDNLKGDVELAKTLQAVSEGLQLSPSARVQVIGHSDLTPIKKSKWPDNTALSRARAQTVARVLTEGGVRTMIDVDGRGESEPLVSPEKDKSDQSRNRRVEVQVTF
jgi:flagellar motor protein MotB